MGLAPHNKCPSSNVLHALLLWYGTQMSRAHISWRTRPKRLCVTLKPAVTLGSVFYSQVPPTVTDKRRFFAHNHAVFQENFVWGNKSFLMVPETCAVWSSFHCVCMCSFVSLSPTQMHKHTINRRCTSVCQFTPACMNCLCRTSHSGLVWHWFVFSLLIRKHAVLACLKVVQRTGVWVWDSHL